MQRYKAKYRYSIILLRQLVVTDFKLRYQGSALGYVWSLLRPLLMFVILYVVFARIFKVGDAVPHYPVYLLLGIVLWNYFVEVTTGAVGAIVSKGDLLRKINFPKYIIVFAGSFSALINLMLNFVVIAAFMVLAGIVPDWHALLIVPLIAELFVLAIGFAFLLSALFVRYRDVSYIWDVIMQAAFYATPILYPLSRIPATGNVFVPHDVAQILLLNPMAQIIQDARYVLVTKETATIGWLYGGSMLIWLIPIGIGVAISFASAVYFRKRSRYFAEEV